MSKKIGIIRCATYANEMACPSVGCFDAFNKSIGSFERYAGSDRELVGIITCTGCPTAKGPKKILRHVRSLAEMGADTIHISSCMMSACPFKKKYARVIAEAYPHIELIEGTHGDLPAELQNVADDFFQSVLEEKHRGMVDLAQSFIPNSGEGTHQPTQEKASC